MDHHSEFPTTLDLCRSRFGAWHQHSIEEVLIQPPLQQLNKQKNITIAEIKVMVNAAPPSS